MESFIPITVVSPFSNIPDIIFSTMSVIFGDTSDGWITITLPFGS
jgi:hypothetical protein